MGFLTQVMGMTGSQAASTNIKRGAKAAGSQRKIRTPKKAAPAQK
jgi:hypothetical protein